MRQIKRDVGLSVGTTQYHLGILYKLGKITFEKYSLHKSFYPVGIFEKNEKQILRILRQETTREILLTVIEMKNPTQTEIVERIKISAPSINWHMQQLIQIGIINEMRDGKYKRYSMTGKTDHIVTLLKNYHPTIWQRWSCRLAEIFLALEMGNKDDK